MRTTKKHKKKLKKKKKRNNMHKLLEQLFNKKGIKGFNDLSSEEKPIFERSKLILSKDELTVKDIKTFCKMQISIIKGKWGDYDTEQAKKAELIPYFTVYSSLLIAIDSPKVAREAEEIRLQALINN